ncbi:hypothetical protein Ahy_B04g071703 isoform B [Arachis hypogaea]|uniref:Uncharacterized protein n=1 Tax=Arachis hypogaea TaxID=3818 RepID=A0A444ZLB6_ARAHY|nr:hypothetical protein Ahy_B04g071703 isoform B [Arachis hypogaea]
MCSGMRLCALL